MGKNGDKKFYNVDQLRKKERKKELQKNKQQRDAHRTAIIKNQDHKEIFKEIEEIDKILMDLSQHPTANEMVLTEKRNKLRGRFHKMLEMYKKEKDEEKVKELNKCEAEYLSNKAELLRFCEQIKKAQNVDINSICMPAEILQMPAYMLPPCQPAMAPRFVPNPDLMNLKPAGPPPGPPPCLSDLLEEEDLVGSEIPIVEYKTESVQQESIDPDCIPPPPMPPSMTNSLPHNSQLLAPRPPAGPTPPMMNNMPLNSQFYGPRPPSGPVPSNVQRFIPPAGYPNMPHYGWPSNSSNFNAQQASRSNMVQSSQQHHHKISRPHQTDRSGETAQGAVVSAAPQRRNLIGEVTAFMPTALMVKRNIKKPAPVEKKNLPEPVKAKETADDAFNLFMKEINNLL